MDCSTALEFLDCIRPNSDDLELSEFAEARTHMESCDSCQQEFASRQEFDTAMVAVVPDVEVPEALQAKLLTAALLAANESDKADVAGTPAADGAESADSAAEDSVSVPGTNEDESAKRISPLRRVLLMASASVACGIAMGIGMWLWSSGHQQFTVAELLQRVDIQLGTADTFDESFAFQLPSGWSDHRLHLGPDVQGQDLDGEDGHEVAKQVFSLTRSRRNPVSGIVIAIPADRMNPRPPGQSFSNATPQYLPRGMVALVWNEGDLVYVVMIRGNASGLEDLQRNFSGPAA